MSLFSRFSVASLLIAMAAASGETCYYPDGETVSTDIACDSGTTYSSCCPSDSFCLSNGLCSTGGITTRASCTDKTWASDECASVCTNTSTSTSIALTPCDADSYTFACGLNNTNCQTDADTFTLSSTTSIILRVSQAEALLADLESQEGKTYTSGAMAGLAVGLGLPLLLALLVALVLLRKEKRKNGPKLMYRPADDHGMPLSSLQPKPSIALTRNASVTTFGSTVKPEVPRSFIERYEHYKNPFASERDLGVPIYEIGSSSPPYSEQERVEAPDKRFSK